MSFNVVQEQNKRMIVLVPDGITNNLDLAHKIHWMAMAEHYDILFLAIVNDEEKMLSLSRNMATLKAVTAANWLTVSAKLTTARKWLNTLKEIYLPGDIIVCHDEQW